MSEDGSMARRLSLIPVNALVFKVVVLLWVLAVTFVYILFFGPPEFWWLLEQIGLREPINALRSWLLPYFTSGYKS